VTDAAVELRGTLTVALAPADAFELFTVSGERRWVPGWAPRFPVPVADETAPGTVFETDHDGTRTTWVVAAAEPGRSIAYARTTPGDRAGLVRVECLPAAGGSEVRVTYTLTALSGEARDRLEEFRAGYPAFLAGWEAAIARMLAGGERGVRKG
jgi:hypothetical protein